MKKLVAFVFILVSFVALAGDETYYVLFVKGTVKNASTGKPLKINDPVKNTDKLTFGSNQDMISVISATKGRFTIKPNPGAKESELSYTVKNTLLPGTARLSTRSGELLNVLDVQNYFGKESFAIFGTLRKRVSAASFPMNSNSFFFVRYTYKGQTINKKLPFSSDTLMISKGDVLKVDGVEISREAAEGMVLYYKGEQGATRLTEVNFIFPDESEVKAQVQVLKSAVKEMGKPDEALTKEITDFLDEVYGFFDLDNAKDFLK
jgi:hypothetical protein